MNRRLYRSRTDTVIGGVAAGVASYLNADPALVRIAWAILVPLTGGAALLAYIVAWIVVPEAPATVSRIVDPDGTVVEVPATPEVDGAPTTPGAGGNGALIVGLILIGAGLWFLLREYLPDFDWSLIWPIILIAIGGLILVTSSRRGKDT